MTTAGSNKYPQPCPHAFIKYITGSDLKNYFSSLKPKPTKKKPFSFDRFNMIVMPIFKFFEEDFKKDTEKNLQTLDLWLSFIKSQKSQNLNTLFETQLNLYLVLSTETVMKAKVFIHMT